MPVGAGLFGVGLGALGGLLARKPPGFKAEKYGLQGLWSPERQQGYAGASLDYLQRVGTGQEKGISRGELSGLTGPGRLHIAQQARRGMMQLGEASLASGQGARGGALGQNILGMQRQALDATRGLEGGAVNFALQQRAADRDRALQANEIGFRAMGAERGLQSDLARLSHESQVARSKVATGLRGAVLGAAAGMGSAMPGYQESSGGQGSWRDFFFGNPFEKRA
jgi:hypothetical protein